MSKWCRKSVQNEYRRTQTHFDSAWFLIDNKKEDSSKNDDKKSQQVFDQK